MQQRSEDRWSVTPKGRIWFGHHHRRNLVGKLLTTKPEGFHPDAYHIVPENESLSSWNEIYQKNRADLSGLLLVYLFYGNDGRVTWSEHRRMKKYLKSEGKRISSSMRITLAGFLDHGFDDDRFIELFRQKEYTLPLFDDAIHAIKVYFNEDGKYFMLAERLKQRIKTQ